MTSQASTWEDDKQFCSDNIREYCMNSTANEILIKEIVNIVNKYVEEDQKEIVQLLFITAKEVMLQLDLEATSQSETSLSEVPEDMIRRSEDMIRRSDRVRKRFDKFKTEFYACYDSGEMVSKSI